MPDTIVTLLTIFGWLAVLIGFVLLVWDAVTHRVLSRAGVAAVLVGVVLLVVAAVVPASATHVDYDSAPAISIL